MATYQQTSRHLRRREHYWGRSLAGLPSVRSSPRRWIVEDRIPGRFGIEIWRARGVAMARRCRRIMACGERAVLSHAYSRFEVGGFGMRRNVVDWIPVAWTLESGGEDVGGGGGDSGRSPCNSPYTLLRWSLAVCLPILADVPFRTFARRTNE